jgi:YbgC/YbaW family acyl-CoA thioester hydrolase
MQKVASESHEVAVRSYELDSYAHVNNGAYLAWFEDARECFLRRGERDYLWYPHHLGVHVVVVNIRCDFLKPAHSGDRLEITTRLAGIGRSSIVFRQLARRSGDDAVCCRARTVMVFSQNERSTGVPPDFRERFEVSPEGDVWTAREGGEPS